MSLSHRFPSFLFLSTIRCMCVCAWVCSRGLFTVLCHRLDHAVTTAGGAYPKNTTLTWLGALGCPGDVVFAVPVCRAVFSANWGPLFLLTSRPSSPFTSSIIGTIRSVVSVGLFSTLHYLWSWLITPIVRTARPTRGGHAKGQKKGYPSPRVRLNLTQPVKVKQILVPLFTAPQYGVEHSQVAGG